MKKHTVVEAYNLEMKGIVVELQKYVEPKKLLLLNKLNFLNQNKQTERYLTIYH